MEELVLEKGIHELILYSEHLEIRGTLEVSPPRRLLDILNDTTRPLMALSQASVLPLARRAGSAPVTVPTLTVRKGDIVVAWLVRETQVESSDMFMTIHKVPHQVIAYAEDFVIRGQFYAIQENTLHQAVDAIHDDFFGLTQPTLYSPSHPDIALKDGMLVAIQRGRLTAMHLDQV
ncbi:MAG: hypothetical protein HYZ68_07465 [Chloroflexi bacterium]|nr:hypothetical protein [Chloroflexota bacterium]